MNLDWHIHATHPRFQLRFHSLFDGGRALAFPCDSAGQVDLDALSERARTNYFYARTTVGRDFSVPTVQLSAEGVAGLQ